MSTCELDTMLLACVLCVCVNVRVLVCVCGSASAPCPVLLAAPRFDCVCFRAPVPLRPHVCRTDNAIKNRWNSTLKRLLLRCKERVLKIQEEAGVAAARAMLHGASVRAESERLADGGEWVLVLVCLRPPPPFPGGGRGVGGGWGGGGGRGPAS